MHSKIFIFYVFQFASEEIGRDLLDLQPGW